MTFKDQLLIDVDVFLDTSVFGDTHNINGVDLPVIVNNWLLDQRKAQGVYTGNILFNIASSNFVLPDNNSYDLTVTFDDKEYLVTSCTESLGMTTVVLSSESTTRYKEIKYRLKAGIGGDKILGILPTKQDWNEASIITPYPLYEELINDLKIENIGVVRKGTVRLQVNKNLFERAELESFEYYINSSVYTLNNGRLIETPYYWVLYLDKK